MYDICKVFKNSVVIVHWDIDDNDNIPFKNIICMEKDLSSLDIHGESLRGSR